MKIRKLSAMPYANAHVEIYEHRIILVSYTTEVAQLTDKGWLYIRGLYSATTRRHIGAFMREYCNSDYYTAKWLYNNNSLLNIKTGEVVKIER